MYCFFGFVVHPVTSSVITLPNITAFSNSDSKGDVISGIPQGTVLRPILLLICVNNLPSMLDKVILFADNANLSSKINNVSSNHML